MQVQSVTNNCYYKPAKLMFGSTNRYVLPLTPEEQLIGNYTRFFRKDLDWSKLIKLLAEKYKNADKVNVLNFACSDGSEPLSLMTALIHNLGEASKKFLPIKASDIDKGIISDAISGKYKIYDDDLFQINKAIGNYSDYFSITINYSDGSRNILNLLPQYKNNITFEQIDMLDAIEEYIEPRNNVIFVRNSLPYFKLEKAVYFVNMLAKKLDSTSLMVIGEFDNRNHIDKLVRSSGFKQSEVPNVYCKNIRCMYR